MTAAASEETELDLTLRRVVVGYRVIGALWLTILGLITLGADTQPERPWLVVATIFLVIAWAAVTVVVAASRPGVLANPAFLAGDVLVAAAALLSSQLAGSTSFSGGYPLSTVFIAAYASGTTAAIASSLAMTAASAWRLGLDTGVDLTSASGQLVLFVFAGVTAAWAFRILRKSDEERRAAEVALLTERAERARAEERAQLAAHLHDSVLQTLALIQRKADESGSVTTLARRQERELRTWLYGDADRPERSFVDAIGTMAAEIEDMHGITVDLVTVGDCTVDGSLEPLVQAAREATVNAAKHSGAGSVSVYTEADQHRVTVFVRDRGIGFEPSAVATDRVGVRDSIEARMRRLGGVATVRSKLGGGTEVELVMPRQRDG